MGWYNEEASIDFASTPSPGRFLWFVSCADTRNEHSQFSELNRNSVLSKIPFRKSIISINKNIRLALVLQAGCLYSLIALWDISAA